MMFGGQPSVRPSNCIPTPFPLCPCPIVYLSHCAPILLRTCPIVPWSYCVPVPLCPHPIVGWIRVRDGGTMRWKYNGMGKQWDGGTMGQGHNGKGAYRDSPAAWSVSEPHMATCDWFWRNQHAWKTYPAASNHIITPRDWAQEVNRMPFLISHTATKGESLVRVVSTQLTNKNRQS